MEFTLDLKPHGIEQHQVTLEIGGFFGRSQLLLDGNPVTRGPREGQFLLTADDGTPITVQLQSVLLDPVPIVHIDGHTLNVAEPFTVMQRALAALSFMIALAMSVAGLVLMRQLSPHGGLIQLMGFLSMTINLLLGLLLGFISMIINSRILRSEMTRPSKIFSMGAITIVVVIGFLIVFILLVGILRLIADLAPESLSH